MKKKEIIAELKRENDKLNTQLNTVKYELNVCKDENTLLTQICEGWNELNPADNFRSIREENEKLKTYLNECQGNILGFVKSNSELSDEIKELKAEKDNIKQAVYSYFNFTRS